MLLVHSNWQLTVCVFKEIAAVKRLTLSVCRTTFNAMIHKYALTEPGIRQWYPFSWSPPEQMLARVFPSFLLRPIRHSFFPRRGWAFIAAERLNPLKALSSLSPSVHYLMMQNTLVNLKMFRGDTNDDHVQISLLMNSFPDVQPRRARTREEGLCHCQGFRYGQVSVSDVITFKTILISSSFSYH